MNPSMNKWKPPIYLYFFLCILGIYLSLVIANCWQPDDDIFTVFPRIMTFLQTNPLSFNFTYIIEHKRTLMSSLFFILFIIGFYIIYDLTKNRNYMPNKEYGDADWAVIARINKRFEDKNCEKGNRIYSDQLRIGMDGDVTKINNNALVIGGSGAGKSFHLLTPNLYQANVDYKYPGSFVITDPKGELLQKNGALLREKGYIVKVLNLVPGMMQESDRFNPLKYIRTETDVIKLINNLFANTTPKGATPTDPFWEKAELMFLQSLFLLVWMEHDRYGWEMSFNTILDLLNKAEVRDDGSDSPLDMIFNQLVCDTIDEKGKGMNHPAYVAYHKSMGGAADTVRSIVISANARLSIFENQEIKRILGDDDLDIETIGTGLISGKKDQKTALFCVIPDSDTSYNCIAGMLYTLLFQELFFQADMKYGGKLPVPVTFWLDEFANIALPSDFLKMLSTMRSRLISCVIIIQNLAQIKAMYEKDWETIPGNCDVCVYLGGNEQSTFEYISKNLGKKTIWKKSHGESKGRNGSSSTNDDVLGRELMLPEQVREMENEYCIVFVRGKKPIFDFKYKTLQSVDFARSKELGYYLHSQYKKMDNDLVVSPISKKQLSLFENIEIINIDLDSKVFHTPAFDDLEKIITENDENEEKNKKMRIDITEMSLVEVLSNENLVLSDDEMLEVTEGLADGLSDDEVKSYILLQDAKKMRSQRLLLEALMKRRMVTTN